MKFSILPVFCGLAIGATVVWGAPAVSKYWDDPKTQALVEAAQAGNASKVAKLISGGAAVNAVGREGFTPLAFAMLRLSKKGFVALLQNGANPNILVPGLPSGDGSIAGLAAQSDDVFWLKALSDTGADLNITSLRSSQTPIYFAIDYNRVNNAKFLLEKKVDLNVINAMRQTPLQAAAVHKRWEIAYLLIEAGSDWKKPFTKNQTIFDMIRIYSDNPHMLKTGSVWAWRNRVILLLESKGADVPKELLASAKQS